jgi:hypothetical protein
MNSGRKKPLFVASAIAWSSCERDDLAGTVRIHRAGNRRSCPVSRRRDHFLAGNEVVLGVDWKVGALAAAGSTPRRWPEQRWRGVAPPALVPRWRALLRLLWRPFPLRRRRPSCGVRAAELCARVASSATVRSNTVSREPVDVVKRVRTFSLSGHSLQSPPLASPSIAPGSRHLTNLRRSYGDGRISHRLLAHENSRCGVAGAAPYWRLRSLWDAAAAVERLRTRLTDIAQLWQSRPISRA